MRRSRSRVRVLQLATVALLTLCRGAAGADFAGAIALQEQGLYDLAALEWQAVIAAAPSDPQTHRARYNLGVCKFKTGGYAAAAPLFEEVVARAAEVELVESALANLGLAYFNQRADATTGPQSLRSALASFDKLLQRFPSSKYAPQARFYRGETLAALGEPMRAAEAFAEVLAADPSSRLARRAGAKRATALALAGKPELALAEYDRLIAAAGASPKQRSEALLGRGTVRMELHKFAEAADDFGAAAAAGPKERADVPLERQGYALYRAEKFAEAAAAYKQLAEQHPRSPLASDARLAAGKCCYLASRPDEAARWFAAIWKDAPGPQSAEAAHWHCQALLASKKNEAALTQATEALATNLPGAWGEKLRMDRADSLAALPGREAEAQAAYLELADAAPRSELAPRALYQAAVAALAASNYQQAQQIADRLLKAYPTDPLAEAAQQAAERAQMAEVRRLIAAGEHARASDLLSAAGAPTTPEQSLLAATALLGAGRSAEALAALEPLGTNDPQALYLRGSSLVALNRPQDAAAVFDRLLQAFPEDRLSQQAHFQRAQLARQVGDSALAKKLLLNAAKLKTNPALALEARFQIGDLEYAAGRFKQAAKQFAAVAAEAAAPAELRRQAKHLEGWSLYKLGDYAPAAQAFQQQLEDSASGQLAADARVMLAESRFGAKEYKPALRGYRDSLDPGKLGPDGPRSELAALAMLHAGQAAGQLGLWDASVRWLDRALDAYPNAATGPECRYESAWALMKLERSEEAARVFQQLADGDDSPLSARSRFMLGELQFAAKQHEDAVRTFFQVAYGYGAPNSPQAYHPWQAESMFEAARCLNALGRAPAAEKLLADLASRFPDHPKAREARTLLQEVPPR